MSVSPCSPIYECKHFSEGSPIIFKKYKKHNRKHMTEQNECKFLCKDLYKDSCMTSHLQTMIYNINAFPIHTNFRMNKTLTTATTTTRCYTFTNVSTSVFQCIMFMILVLLITLILCFFLRLKRFSGKKGWECQSIRFFVCKYI